MGNSEENYGGREIEDDFSLDFDFNDGGDAVTKPDTENDELLIQPQPTEDSSDDFADDFTDTFSDTGNDKAHEGQKLLGLNKLLESNALGDGVVAVDLSPDDLMNGVFVDDSEDEDLQEFNAMCEQLLQEGYKNLEEYPYDVLKKLMKRCELTKDGSNYMQQYTEGLQQYISKVEEYIAGSRVTYEGTDDALARVNYLKNNSSMQTGTTRAVAKFIDDVVHSSVIQNREVTVDDIYNKIVASPLINDYDSDLDRRQLRTFIAEVIPIVVNFRDSESDRQIRSDTHRHKLAKYLMRVENEKVDNLIDLQRHNKLTLVKKIVKEQREFYVICSGCGKRIRMKHSPLTLIRYASERLGRDDGILVPIAYECACGKAYIFSIEEYENMRKRLYKNKAIINDAVKYSNDFCSGAGLIRLEPAIASLEETIEYLIEEHLDDTVESQNIESESDVLVELDDIEILNAAKIFYAKMSGMGVVPIGTMQSNAGGKMSVINGTYINVAEFNEGMPDAIPVDSNASEVINREDVARHICNVLSLDYQKTKNKAVFSLFLMLNENRVFGEYLSMQSIIEMENTITLVKSTDDSSIKYITLGKKKTLVSIAASLKATNSGSTDYKNMTAEESIQWLCKHIDLLKNELDKRKQEMAKCIKFIEERQHYFGYCKIVNVSTFKLLDCMQYLANKELVPLAKSIADLMIINNYAGEFYNNWERLGIMNPSSLRKALTVRADRMKALTILVKSVERKLGILIKNNPRAIFISATESHDQIQKVLKSAKTWNFYRFCRQVSKLLDNEEDLVDKHNEYLLSISVRNCKLAASKVLSVSEIEYFLGSQFSQQELQENAALFESLSFGMLVLRRKEGETPKEYVKRFNETMGSSEVDYSECISYAGKFDQLTNELRVLTSVSLFSSMEYENYSTSVFMSKLLEALLCTPAENNGLNVENRIRSALGINEVEYFRVVNDREQSEGLSVDSKGMLEILRILNGYYFTDAEKRVAEFERLLETKHLTTSDLEKFTGTGSVDVMIGKLLDIVGREMPDGGESVTDSPEEMMQEIADYISSKRFNKLI